MVGGLSGVSLNLGLCDNTDKGILMESSCPSILPRASHPVGRPDAVLKWWLLVLFPFTSKVLLPHSFLEYYNLLFFL